MSAVPSPIISNEKRESDQLRPSITVIATDVDGTLLDSKQQLRGETVAALKAAMAKGIQVLIATGKARGPWIDTVLPQLGLTTPGVYMQGLILYDGDGSILYERCMDEDVARKVIRLGVEENVTVTAYCGNRILCAERDKHTDRLIGYGEPVPEAMGSLLDVVGKIPINKLLYMGEQSAIDAIRPAVQAALGREATLVTALNGMLEVLPRGASKGLGLKMVLERMAVDARHVLAIGDGENDIEMLRTVGTSVAMGNAGAEVKAAAQFVTSSNDESGLALAVESFVLGGLESGRCRVGEGGRIEMVERVEVMR
ncbi:Haloacid dehalogenase-like hydrolase (HAD) family protein [Klebsormidium nitens]|uniref:Haloacid dehalogenase-like hydrolase (HAD) family protein n=1 Tax=Klebsormidium nitens TaxID=105231 RepID=A0A0U9HKK9_KLENI|nr:Haloacid dehalogenase-like hydrolase (HAD) family protein [Klebsormidium nitens]|eukprot:GAQ89757.1 Haloacid dehalogenase-like hydrolase (HAD) family protein [Klebsormidium nitens]